MGIITDKANQAYSDLKARQDEAKRNAQKEYEALLTEKVKTTFGGSGWFNKTTNTLIVKEDEKKLNFQLDSNKELVVEVECPRCRKTVLASARSYEELGIVLNEIPPHDHCYAVSHPDTPN